VHGTVLILGTAPLLRRWIELVDMAPIPHDASFRSIIVPTADSVAITFMLRSAVENRWGQQVAAFVCAHVC